MKASFLVAPLLLVGCNDHAVDVKDAKPSEVAAKVADAGGAMKIRPGEWSYRTKIEKFDMPGLPPAAAAAMQKAHAGADIRACLTEADVAKPDAKTFGAVDKSCKFDRFSMDGGKISYEMTCKPAGGGEMRAKVDGTYGADSYAMTMQSQTAVPGGGPGMSMLAKIDGKRVGECKAKEGGV